MRPEHAPRGIGCPAQPKRGAASLRQPCPGTLAAPARRPDEAVPASAALAPRRLAAVILASGFSRRMEANKLLLDYGGRPLIARVMDAAAAAKLWRVTVVTAYDEIMEMARQRGMDVIKNDRPEVGQSRSVVLGTRANGKADGIMYIPGDMPFLTGETLEALKAAFAAAPERIIRPVYGGAQEVYGGAVANAAEAGKAESGAAPPVAGVKALSASSGAPLPSGGKPGSPVIFPRALFGELCALEGDRGGREVIAAHPELVRFIPVAERRAGVDIDTPEDARRWLEIEMKPDDGWT